MSSSTGRSLLEATPERRIGIHRQNWPDEFDRYSELFGTLMKRLLIGDQVIVEKSKPDESPSHIGILGLSSEDRTLLGERFSELLNQQDEASGAGFHRWTMELPRSWAVDKEFTMADASHLPNYIYLSDEAVYWVARILCPIFRDLSAPLRLRSGDCPETTRGVRTLVERSVDAYRTLGLDWQPVRELLDTSLGRGEVIELRGRLLQRWAEFPDDVGDRALALMTHRLAVGYYRKALKDGTARSADVLGTNNQVLLAGTLSTWERFVGYLGEHLHEVDAVEKRPVAISIPSTPPSEISSRIRLIRRWFLEVFDPTHSKQEPGEKLAWGLVPVDLGPEWERIGEAFNAAGSSVEDRLQEPPGTELQVSRAQGSDGVPPARAEEEDESISREKSMPWDSRDVNLWWTILPRDLLESIRNLWGTTVLQRFPETKIDVYRPEGRFAELIAPVVSVWEDIALTCWFSCFGTYNRTDLLGLEDYLSHPLKDLVDAGCPVDLGVFEELRDICTDHPWLLDSGRELIISVDTGEAHASSKAGTQEEGAEVFRKLRDISNLHRRKWLDQFLDIYLDNCWRRSLEQASRGYQELEAGRGRPPTVKQAFPSLSDAAISWFGGDLSRTARVLGLDGPAASAKVSRSQRSLPGNIRELRLRTFEILTQGLSETNEDYWPRRRRESLSFLLEQVLSYWQASGEFPSRAALRADWLFDGGYGGDREAGYLEFRNAVRQALEEAGHLSAIAFE